MALTKAIDCIDSFGDERSFPLAYIKLSQISGNKGMLQVVFSVYRTKEENLIKSFSTGFSPDLSGDNFIKQAYLHLKTLPEFADAIDC